MKALAEMTAGQLNRRLDSIAKKSSKITEEFIRAGRGSERPSDIWKLSDKLAQKYKFNSVEYNNVQDEITRRYGPGLHRAPIKSQKNFRSKNPVTKRYFLYDVLNDYSVAKVDGKSDFGTLAHAKTRAVKDNGGRRVLWAKKDMPGMDKSFDNWFGRNTDNELINIISTHGMIRSNPKARKKNPVSKSAKSHLWQIALFDKYNPVIHFYGGVSRGQLAFTQQRSKGILLKTKSEAKKIAETVPERFRKKFKFNVAVVPESMTLPQLRKELGLPAGKA